MEWSIVIVYLFGPAALTVLGAPIAALFFQDLPRDGAAFALPTALIPFTITIFWIGQVTFGLHTLVLGVVVVLVCAVVAVRVGASPEWQSVVVMFGVFTIGFLIMVGFRAADPGITPAGGEQFLHFGLVNAIERANSLPPQDMWFAGRQLKYYYGTQLQVTSLSMLSGTSLRYGFNLGIATFYGLLFVVAYGVGGAIAHRQGHAYRLGGVFGAFFVTLAGPTTTALRFAVPYLPDALAEPLKPAAFGFVATRFNDGNLSQTITALSDPFEWGWWYTRYVVPGTIQEVPLYSFVKADLHGHTFANGYVLFAGALALAYYATPAAARARRCAIVFGGLGSVAGLFGFMNTWSLPTAGGLAVLAVAAADPHPATLLPEPWGARLRLTPMGELDSQIEWVAQELWRLLLALCVGAIVLLIGIVIAAPFLVFGQVPTNNGIGLLPPRSPLGPFLVIYGGLLSIFAIYVWTCGRPVVSDSPNRWVAVGSLILIASIAVTVRMMDFGVLAVLGPLILAGWLLVRSDRGSFALVLLIAGAGLLLSFELVHARLPLIDDPRWNTSLKVAVQGWTLGAAGAGAAIATLVAFHHDRLGGFVGLRRAAKREDDEGKPSASNENSSPSRNRSTRHREKANGHPLTTTDTAAMIYSVLTIALVSTVLFASAVFPIMMVGTEIGSEVAGNHYNPSVDGHEAAERFHSDEYEALLWLKNRPGHPTLVEAPGSSYDWTSPAATFSGLPGVIGWDHEEEYRSPDAYQRRVEHVDEIYTGEWSDAVQYLKRYSVTYLYLGPNEGERYGTELRSFDQEGITVAFEAGNVTIYEVDRSNLQS